VVSSAKFSRDLSRAELLMADFLRLLSDHQETECNYGRYAALDST
jgi:hypothetical protein